MCGIAGILDLEGRRPIAPAILTRMANALAHRGPDGAGFFSAPGIGLAHRRLAIIDLAGGHQPFRTADRCGVLTYNGEVYNFQDLRQELKNEIPLSENGDTEVLAEGINRYGPGFLDRLRGMFAFGFWQTDQRTLTLARDRYGEKPLFYGTTNDGFFAFASDINALLASALFERKLNNQSIADYFQYGYVPDPDTIFCGIAKLKPGHLLQVRPGAGVTVRPYWQPDMAPTPDLPYQKAAEQVRERVHNAVSTQMISDVPLGAFLSGGVDSSVVVASMAQGGSQPVTCSIGFNEISHDERHYAREIAALFHTQHHEDTASIDVTALIDPVAAHFGEPFADSSALPSFMVAKLARHYVTVALSGDGGDEIFAGYRRYPMFLNEERVRSVFPGALRRSVFGPLGALYPKLDTFPRPFRFKTTFTALGESSGRAYARAGSILLPEQRNQLLSDDFRHALGGYDPLDRLADLYTNSKAHTPLDKALDVDRQTWLAGRMLVKVDRTSMAHSLEVRPPLLDPQLAALARALPPDYKLAGANGKKILKTAFEPALPVSILYRQKQGFGLPLAAWLRRGTQNPLDRLVARRAWAETGIIDAGRITQMMAEHRTGRRDHSQALWSVLMFDAFMEHHGLT